MGAAGLRSGVRPGHCRLLGSSCSVRPWKYPSPGLPSVPSFVARARAEHHFDCAEIELMPGGFLRFIWLLKLAGRRVRWGEACGLFSS